MDWNWFFSSVAQSIAALVGVLGAFLVSRLLNNETSYRRSKARTDQLLRESSFLRDSAGSRKFAWYNLRIADGELSAVKWKVLETGEFPSPEDCYNDGAFSPYMPREDALRAIEQALEEEQKRLKEPIRSHSLLASPLLASPTYQDAAITAARRRALDDEGESIVQLVLRIKSHIREVQEHLDAIETQPERSAAIRVVLVAILALFMAGVVLPLSYLPVQSGTSPQLGVEQLVDASWPIRTIILGIATGVVVALVLALLIRNEQLIHRQEDLADLKQWLQPDSYSEYLRIRIENGFPL